jgi:hypothetical protein
MRDEQRQGAPHERGRKKDEDERDGERGSDSRPKTPMPSSTSENRRSAGLVGFFETSPPTRLPTPSPSMNAVTMTVTDSTLMP